MAKTAVRPDFLNHPILTKHEEALQKKGITDEERALYHMGETTGWREFTKKKEDLINALDLIQQQAMSTASLEQIGQNALIINQVKGLLSRLWGAVDDAKEVCEGATT